MTAIVLLPGFMADAALWDDVLPALCAVGPVSHGDLSRCAGIPEMAQAVLAQAPGRFALVGFSMGGYVARAVTRTAPERVCALVLVATSARADTLEQARKKRAAAEAVDPTRFTGLSRRAIVGSLHPDRAGDAATIERIRLMGERLGGEVFVRQAMRERAGDLDRLGEIRCPTLIVAAAQDALRSLDEAVELRDGIVGAELTVIDGSGHMLPIEAPARLTDAVVPWLRGATGRIA